MTVCDSLTWLDSITYTASNNSAIHTMPNHVGCDSIITLNLTVLNSSNATDTHVACDSFVWIDSTTYTASNNSATYTYTNHLGCDSIVTLDLTIFTATTGTDSQTACDSFIWIDGNTYTSSNNTETYIIPNSNGCDSIITLDLSIINIDSSLTLSNDSIIANQASAAYQWLDCDSSMAIIVGATAQGFIPSGNGNYAVEINLQGCTDTSICVNFSTVAFHILDNGNQVILYPNPTEDFITIEFDQQIEQFEIKIFDSAGRLLRSSGFTNQRIIQLPMNYPSGAYMISIQTKKDRLVFPVIKE